MPQFSDNPDINNYLTKYNSRYSPNPIKTHSSMAIPAVAGLALNAGSWLINNISSNSKAAQQYRYNSQLQQREMDYNSRENALAYARQHAENELAFNREKEWALNERAYNSPSAQLSRLRAAGINPAVGIAGIENTVSNPLDMSAASPNGASVGGAAVGQAPVQQFPDMFAIMQGMKGLELLDSQIQETNSRTALNNMYSENVAKDIEKKNAYSPFWSDIARYDTEGRYYNARTVYRDILEKIWRYNNYFPKELQKITKEIEGIDLNNRFNKESFSERLAEIVNRNLNISAQTGYYGDLKRNINSAIGMRDYQVTQGELTGAAQRSLFKSQEALNAANKQIKELERQITEDINKGNYIDAFKKGMILNFLQQARNGSLLNGLPSPNMFAPNSILGGDINGFQSDWLPLRF